MNEQKPNPSKKGTVTKNLQFKGHQTQHRRQICSFNVAFMSNKDSS